MCVYSYICAHQRKKTSLYSSQHSLLRVCMAFQTTLCRVLFDLRNWRLEGQCWLVWHYALLQVGVDVAVATIAAATYIRKHTQTMRPSPLQRIDQTAECGRRAGIDLRAMHSRHCTTKMQWLQCIAMDTRT